MELMMINKNVLTVVFLFFSFFSYVAIAQNDGEPFVVGNAKVHKVQSAIVPNQIYEVRVSLPGSYYQSLNKTYPIVVVLDGQWNFTIVSDIVGKLSYDGMIPEAITVGITWGGEGDDPNVLRVRDFIRPELPYLPLSGGASAFLSSLTEELIPYVKSRYRVGEKKVLMGASFGGLFTSYAMLEKPKYFDGYVAIAGSYVVDSAYLDEKLASYAHTKTLKDVRSYLAVGSLDTNEAHVETFNNSIKAAHLKNFKHKHKVFDGVGHGGVEPLAYTYGLQYVFERPFVKLSEQFLQRYTGEFWGGPVEGQPLFPITISVAGKGLLSFSDGQQTFQLQAENETSFYWNGANISATFTGTDKIVFNSQGTVFYFQRATP
jgi:predicted alpha/beta superfamily hydrolase